MKHLFRLVLLVVFLLPTFNVQAQTDPTADLEALLEEYADETEPAVSIRITTEDGSWAAATGRIDVSADAPATTDSRFRIASMSKTFVAVVLMQLVEEGKLSLDDPISKWLPEHIVSKLANAESATIFQLATMTSGIPEYLDYDFYEAILEDPTYEWTAPEVLEYAYGLDAYFAPGEDFEYTNTNYILLQLIIEAATEKPLHVVVRERILDPLGLSNTYTQLQEELSGGFVHGYEDFDEDGTVDDVTLVNDGAGLGDGALISNTADLARFYQALFINDELLKPETLQQMIDAGDENEYGIGLSILSGPDGVVIGHDGAVSGFTGAVYYVENSEAIVVYLQASDEWNDDVFMGLMEILQGFAENH